MTLGIAPDSAPGRRIEILRAETRGLPRKGRRFRLLRVCEARHLMLARSIRPAAILLFACLSCKDRQVSNPPSLEPIALALANARLPAIVDAAALGPNRWAVLDLSRRITLVDTLGKATSSIDLSVGRLRELHVPFSIAARPTGAFAVADMASGKVAEFTAGGQFDRIADVGGSARGLWWTASALVVKSVAHGRIIFLGLGSDGHASPSVLHSMDFDDASSTTCSYCAAAVDAKGNIALAGEGTEYSIGRAHHGRLATGFWTRSAVTPGHHVARDRDSLTFIIDQALSELRKEGQSETYIRGFRSVLEARLRDKPLIHGRALAFDTSGCLWVQPAVDPADSSVLDVFAPAGQFVGRISVGRRLTLLSISNGQVVLRSNVGDTLGSLFAYRIVRH